ncbi:MAG: hypothetical protein QOI21_5605 [Actinomycetota bacterium]|jgi:amino acid adenylation domain-containing protein/non-ribosomal peptide synthase protein (TIGR01720 family)|nr:hypothetical protein [Actinomycetota bacterium]
MNERFALSADRVASGRKLAVEAGTGFSRVLIAAAAVCLDRLTGDQDLVPSLVIHQEMTAVEVVAAVAAVFREDGPGDEGDVPFDAEHEQRVLAVFDAMAAHLDRPIGTIELLTEHERAQVLVEFGTSPSESVELSWTTAFERVAARKPDAVAIVCENEQLTYAELDAAANQLARSLRVRDVRAEDVVAVAMPRSINLVVALLGVMKAGAAYLPLDLDHPEDRVAFMLADAGARIVVTTTELAELLPVEPVVDQLLLDVRPEPVPGEPLEPITDLARAAYVIYTSGSTGRPKGVILSHDGIGSLISTAAERIGITPESRVVQFASTGFDVTVWDLVMSLCVGGRVVMVPAGRRVAGAELTEYIAEHEATHMILPPSLVAALPHDCHLPEGAVLIVGTETVPPELIARWSETLRVVAAYGLTEATVNSTLWLAEPGWQGPIPIGKPDPNTRCYVLDSALRPVPVGVEGELYVGGRGLARGYVGRSGLTSERFVADPFAEPDVTASRSDSMGGGGRATGGRMYRTGDRVSWRPDGNLAFHGRADHQVKIRGYRIEPGEIESVLAAHEAVARVAVVAREVKPGDRRLVAYIVPALAAPAERDVVKEQVQVGEWKGLHELLYAVADSDPFDEGFTGWNSMYDGEPLPLDDMRAWRAATVDAITALKPKRVLEIGVGSGLILSKVAPHCDAYWGLDLSEEVIGLLRRRVAEIDALADRVELRAQPAHDFDGLLTDFFDTVVINSVAQYFPSADYFVDVVTKAMDLLTPGGSLFVGDVRNLRLLRCLRAAVETGRSDSVSAGMLDASVAWEGELLLDPDFFPALGEKLDAGVDVRIKRARYHNELSRYRYDVVLRKGAIQEPVAAPELVWGKDFSDLAELAARLEETRVTGLRVTGLPNARLAGDLEALRSVDGVPVVADALFDPETLVDMGTELGYQVAATWSGDAVDGSFDVLFTEGPISGFYRPGTANTHANTPSPFRDPAVLMRALRAYADDALPSYLVPAAFVPLDRLPFMPNGKLDRAGLPAPDFGAMSTGRPPRTPREELLCGIFADILGVASVGIDDDFFVLGGDSILSIRLVLGAANHDLTVTPRQIFQHRTVEALAAHAEVRVARELDATPLVQLSQDESVSFGEFEEVLPVSPLQAGFYFHAEFDRTVADVYTIQEVFDLDGPVDATVLRRAAQDLVDRHSSLRSSFRQRADGQVLQVVHASVPVVWRVAEGPVETELAADRDRRFELDQPELIRFTLLKLDEERSRLAITFHHIVADGWSVVIMMRELLAGYGARGTLPPASSRHEYLRWLTSRDDEAARAAWGEALAGIDEPTRLVDAPATVRRPEKLHVRLPESVTAALGARTRERGLTLGTVLHGAWGLLLGRLTGRTDLLFGSTVSGRGAEVDRIESAVGLFINTLPLRLKWSPQSSIGDTFARLQQEQAALLDHQHLGLAELQGIAGMGQTELFDTLVVVENYPREGETGAALRVTGVEITDAVHFPVALIVSPGRKLEFTFKYDAARLSATAADELAQRFVRVLEAVAADLDQPIAGLELLSAVEQGQLLELNATARSVPEHTLAQAFEAQVARTPDATAVVFEDRQLSYAELDARAEALARRLRAHGAAPEQIVAVAVPRSVELMVALLGVLKSGAAYLPIDLDYPQDRIAFMFTDSGASTVVTTAESARRLPEGAPSPLLVDDIQGHFGEKVPSATGPGCPAYLIYTSGSTGRPKGVLVSHRAIVNRLAWMQDRYGLTADDRVLQKTPSSFDVSVWEFFWALLEGAAVVLARPDGHRDPAYLARVIGEQRITTLHFVPSMLGAFLAADEVTEDTRWPTGLRRIFSSGEALPGEVAARWHALTGVPLHNLYGPTEAAVDVSYFEYDGSPGTTVPIGRPVWNTRLHVLDACLRPVPVGVAGELYLAGDQLARGYHGRAALTAERFVADPFGNAGGRLYRTGDLVRRRADGEIEYLGRTDRQVKIRGNRIELGEIESALAAQSGVGRVAVAAKNGALIGYVVPAGGLRPQPESLRAALTEALPAPMVPSAFVVLDEFPLTPSGKLDVAALPVPSAAALPSVSVQGPRSAGERVLIEVFSEVLGLAEVGIDGDFFLLGGDSISSISVSSRARRHGLDISPKDVFELKTPAALAALGADLPEPSDVDAVGEAPLLPGMHRPLTPSDLATISLSQAEIDVVSRVSPAPLADIWSLSPLQEGLFFHSSYDQARIDVYTVQEAVDFDRSLDANRLRAACAAVQARNPSLRAGFTSDGLRGPVQFVVRDFAPPVTEIDLTGCSGVEQDRRLAEVMAADRTERFDLSAPPLFRLLLVRLGAERDRVVIHRHLLLWDGWSAWLFLERLFALYELNGDDSSLPAPGFYRDYLSWLDDQDTAHATAAWREALSGLAEPTLMGQVSQGMEPVSPVNLDALLSAETTDLLRGQARRHGLTANSVLNVAWGLVLSTAVGRQDIVFGAAVAGRPSSVPDIETTIGLFLNTVPARITFDPRESVLDLLRRVQSERMELSPYEFMSLGVIQREAGHRVLFDTLFVLRDADGEERSAALRRKYGIAGLANFDATHYPLTLVVTPGERLRVTLSYRDDVIEDSAAESLLTRFTTLVETLIEDFSATVGALDTTSPGERTDLVRDWDSTVRSVPNDTVADLLAGQAARTPDAIALVFGEFSVTYAELEDRINRMARLLLARGAAPERIVALGLPRSIDMVVALFAVLRTGAAYLPLELDYPIERLAMMLDDAQPLVLVSTSEVAAGIPDETPRVLIDTDEITAELESLSGTEIHDYERPQFARGNARRLEHPAYVIYTSGSTGKPKGVLTPYRGLTNMQLNHQQAIFAPAIDAAGGRRLRIAHTVSFAFDMSWEELLWLIEGHQVHVCDEELRRDAEALVAYCNTNAIDVINVTPTYAHLLIEEGLLEGHRPALVLLGGEAVSESVWNRLRDTEGTYGYNLYGPTEYTINTLGGGTTDSETPTVGKPIRNTRAYILDAWLRPVPDGVPGELYISGTGLARGYLDRRSLTSERFVADPFGEPGTRMYRTGDLVRRRADGNLDFLGRTDDQVKIRGYRVELGEIESVLVRHPQVAHAAVIARPDPSAPGTQRLVGYVVPAELTGEARDRVEAEQVAEWEQIYSDEYTEIPTAMFHEDFAGWDSSYDGDPIPLPHMREWRAATVARIAELNPKRMLEIGVGTGLLLSCLAPIAEEYWGTDLAAPVIGKLKADLSLDPELAAKVNLRAQPAHEPEGLPRGHFDTIVINSVIQYFPSVDYLTDVITTALELLAPGGALFIGDIRSLRLVRSFHTAIQLTRADESSDPGHLRRAIERGVSLEKELLIDPEYFAALQRTIPGIGVEVKTKRARLHNELSRYRYDAVLYREPADVVSLAQAPMVHWGGDLAEVRAQLAGDSLRVTRIPDARIGAEYQAMRLLDNGGTLVDVVARFRSGGDGVEPEALHDLGAELGYQVHTTWSSTVDGTFDAVFVRGKGRTAGLYLPASAGTNLANFANTPTAARGSSGLIQRLREELKEKLPDYMVPTAFVTLASLPLTDNGKLNVKALPDADLAVGLAESRDAESPQEESLCALFAEVLGLERVGVEDNFFDLGGHSLLATRLISRARTELGAELAIRDLFEAPTPAKLAERATGGEPARPTVTAVERPERIPLSPAQKRLLLLEELGEVGEAYNFPLVFRLRGELDVAALRVAFGDVVARHESLRTVFGDHEGEPFQLILDTVQPAFEISACEESEMDEFVAELAGRAFDLRSEIPLRVGVLRLGERDHVLAVVLHHIATDEWSDRPFFADLTTAYQARSAGRAPGWAPLPVQYADYTLWQRSLLDRLAPAQLAFWTETLRALPEELALPLDRTRPAVPSGRGAKIRVELPAPVAGALRGLSAGSGTSLFMLLHTAVATLLHRMGAGDDIPLGAPVAGRTDDALNDLVGFFVNTLVLRADLSGEPTFAELLARVREADLAAFSNQELPFERVVEALNPARIAGRNPLFQVMVGYHYRPGGDPAVLGLPTEWRELPPESAKFDLHFTMVDETVDGKVTLLLEYAEDLADRDTATRLLERLVSVLGQAVADPARPLADFDVLTGDELELVGTKWNDTGREFAAATLPELFEAQVARTPDAVAVVFEDAELTYAELNARANRLARWLIEVGAGPESVVAVALPRSVELVVALYAVHKAGAAYLPLDTGYPTDRLAFMVEDAAPVCVLDDLGLFDRLDAYDDSNPVRELSPVNPAYVIYTSGSTGKPKGVVVSHSGIVNRLLWTQDEYRLDNTDRVLQKTPSSFDVSVWEFFWPLITGATLVVAKPDGHREPRYLAELIQAQRVTTVHFVPSMLRLFLEEPESAGCTGLRRVLCSGEALPEDLAARFRATLDGGLHNLYGPTEASVDVTSWAVVDGPVAIGRPVWNTEVHVLDARLRPVAPGVAGELYLAGAQLARGYLGRAGLTAERFVANPFMDGTRLYRTGDLARWRADGAVEYLGRVDEQVKLRGFRIELGEIETVLASHSSVAHIRVVAREDRLVAYVVPAGSLAMDEVRSLAELALPDYMVPSAFVEVAEIPLTPNGKLDRKALRAPEFIVGAGRQPNTARETALCELFAAVLGVDHIGVDDDFFALGGHSLLVMRLAGRIRSAMGVEVSLRAVFDAPTVARLAAVLSGAEQCRPTLFSAVRPELLPLSAAQQSLRFLYSLEGASPTYNIPVAWRLTGRLDLDALRVAVHDVVGRHEALRTIFPDHDGVLSQRIVAPEHARVHVVAVQADELAATADYCFELDRELPLRVTFARVAPGEHLVLFLFHHIAGDEWSERPFFADFANAYSARVAGTAPQWTPLPVQYADFALWQRSLLGTTRDPGAVAKHQLDFWREALADLPEELALPVDRPRPQEASYRGGRVLCTVDTAMATGLRELARVHDVSMFMLVQAGVATLLHRLGVGTDIPLGAPISGRTEESLEDLVGYFLNSLVLRTDLSGNPSFTELLGRVRETDLAAFGNQDFPFDRLVEALNPARSLARHPLFQVMVVYLAAGDGGLSLPGLSAEREPVEVGTSKFDLSFDFVEEQGGAITVSLEYSSDLFDRSTVERFGGRLLRVLAQIVADPSLAVGSIEVLDADERELIVRGWNNTASAVEPSTLPALFEAQAAKTPDAIAVVSGDVEWTFAELNDGANRLARLLVSRGAGPEDLVALMLPRSAEVMLSILAVHKAGAAYLPVDPDYPAERITAMLDDAQPLLVLTVRDLAATLPETRLVVLDECGYGRHDGENLTDADRLRPLSPQNPAYVIYTSGSTGRPKGVVVAHRSVVNLFHSHRETLYRPAVASTGREQLRVGHAWSFAFDASWQPQLWLLDGHAVHVVPEEIRRDPELLAAEVRRAQFDFIEVTPSYFAQMADVGLIDGDECPLAVVGVGGEAVPTTLWERLGRLKGTDAFNLYGPTESTVDALVARIDDSARPLVGRPVANTRAYVLDDGLNPVPAGVRGELYLAGGGLARGYLGQAALTAERFVADPFDVGGRLYRTGDLAKWTADGRLDFGGRADDQVKIRGFRIEPAEIEAALERHQAVSQALVVVRDGRQLVAYVVTDGVDSAELRDHVGGLLPEYMVPAAFVSLVEFPVLSNGKLDRKALPAPDFTGLSTGREPRTDLEKTLSAVFSEVLDIPALGIDDDFFALGGDSIVAMQLVGRARAAGLRISPREVFQHRTVAGLGEVAAHISTQVVADDGTGTVALTPVMHAMRELGGPISGYQQAGLLLTPASLDLPKLVTMLAAVAARHDMLRARLDRSADWTLRVAASVDVERWISRVDIADVSGKALRKLIAAEAVAARSRLDPDAGALVQVVWFDGGDRPGRLLVMIHHLAVDGVSWRILMPDLEAAWAAVSQGRPVNLPAVPTSFRRWSKTLAEQSGKPEVVAELPRWTSELEGGDALPLLRPLDHARDVVATARTVELTLPSDRTAPLLSKVPAVFRATVNDVLLTALALAVADWRRRHFATGNAVLVDLESHGRDEELIGDADLSRTVGWFTSVIPVNLDPGELDLDDALAGGPAASLALERVKGCLPERGVGFGLLRHLNPETAPRLAALARPQIEFNYMGRFGLPEAAEWSYAEETDIVDLAGDPGMPVSHSLTINAATEDRASGPELAASWVWPQAVLTEESVRDLAETWFTALDGLAARAAVLEQEQKESNP